MCRFRRISKTLLFELAPFGDLAAKLPKTFKAPASDIGQIEARRPKEPAVISEIDGSVKFGGVVRGNREVLITSEDGEERKYLVPYGKHLRVHEGDLVVAGERLSEGAVNPHDILQVRGVHMVQEYLVNEIQDVYRLQAVEINDKHIEVIVRQMLQKVRLLEPGDTNFLEDFFIDQCVPTYLRRVEGENREHSVGENIGFTPVFGTTEPKVDGCLGLRRGRGPDGFRYR